mgnify:CR=1 FL=1
MDITIFWFRRDLRIEDNAGLYHALKSECPVQPIFIFDSEILDELDDKKDKRVNFIYQQILKLQQELKNYGSSLEVLIGKPVAVFKQLLKANSIKVVYTNTDYEPYAMQRDKDIAALLKEKNIDFKSYKDQVIFHETEVLKDNGEPYTVYTPYSKKWKSLLQDFHLKAYPSLKYRSNFVQCKPATVHALSEIGFEETEFDFPAVKPDKAIIKEYHKTRDTPGINGTSHLGLHLRFGTISIRHLATMAKQLNETFLNELIWREFFMMILWYYPKVVNTSFREEYDNIKWRNNDKEFEQWCKGNTGYPLVDAGMRELNETGFMHNRVRMVTASFLCKHLLIDWRWGEAYFAKQLLDYDLSANNGNWQWAAGTGCDAAPYFRIFSPKRQTERFDPELKYIKKWVPELESFNYPEPMVDHDAARKRCLEVYKKALNK